MYLVQVQEYCTMYVYCNLQVQYSESYICCIQVYYGYACSYFIQDPGHVPKCHTGKFEKLATEIFRDALPPPYVNSISVPSLPLAPQA